MIAKPYYFNYVTIQQNSLKNNYNKRQIRTTKTNKKTKKETEKQESKIKSKTKNTQIYTQS